MGTEVAISFSSLRTQLENEKSSLFKIDENIKKIVQTTGRFNDRFNSSGEYPRGNNRTGGRNAFLDGANNFKNEDQFAKRKHETKTVFSRLSARVHDSDGEEDGPGNKRARVPSAVCRELPTRAAVLRAQGDDEQARTRNRRIFGSLLGTLQKFKQEEIGLQTKEDKKAQVERKIEEQARLEKEREQKERKTLFAEREHKKATIKALEAKMGRVQEFEKWEASQKNLGNFILTKSKPHVYWLPKKMSDKANEKLDASKKYHEKYMTKKKQELQEELHRIEQRCLRPRGPGGPAAKENDPAHQDHQDSQDTGVKKRDKFAMDVDKEDSENEDAHEEENHGVTKENGEQETETKTDVSKQESSIDQDTSMEPALDSSALETPQVSMEVSALDESQAGTVQSEENS
ncbi:unnamed protein product [Arctia plantaginis]|uniref:Pinin/SDK/MemA protein domain-containing protein n=1 Tax=Arctia plantaginis TaxID=874455 RepID=A0A8S1AU54_ARCPL|nr:unnamed protein product [Arctia plantaginis]